MIKFFDIANQDKKYFNEIFFNLKKNIKKTDFILGKNVKLFEKEFAKYCNSKYAISCANGTDALTIALKSLNFKKGSEVILPAMTYCSTLMAVLNANLKPVLVDIEKNSSSVDIDEIKKKISKKTKAIIPVHLYGSSVNLSKLKKIIKKKKIILIDDCAQAHGAYDNSSGKKLKIGSICDISCFSFYPGKNLGAYGDAGIITTNKVKFCRKISSLRNLGSEIKFKHKYLGLNSRLDTLQATILRTKLKYLDYHNQKRKKIARNYSENINNKKIVKLNYSKYSVHHQYVIKSSKRNLLIQKFKKNKIQYGFHYPYPLNKLDFVKKIFKKQNFPNAEELAVKGISIPIDPYLKKKDQKKIINVINSL